MKKITLVLTLLTSTIFSQKYIDTLYNFKVIDGNIIWQKVIESEEKNLQETFRKKVITNIKFEDFQEVDNIISFNVVDDIINFKKYGGKLMFTSFHVQEPKNYHVVIDFKENKYRITIKQITVNFENTGLGKSKIEDFVTKKNKIKNSKTTRKDLNYYQKHFLEKFSLAEKTDNDW